MLTFETPNNLVILVQRWKWTGVFNLRLLVLQRHSTWQQLIQDFTQNENSSKAAASFKQQVKLSHLVGVYLR